MIGMDTVIASVLYVSSIHFIINVRNKSFSLPKPTISVSSIFLSTSFIDLHLTGILPCAILIPGLFFIPESPRWLVCPLSLMEEFKLLKV